MLDMEELWQFPCCWAAINGFPIPLKCPNGGLAACKEYHNFENLYSIVLMGLVDAKYRFIWGSCGFPGNSHDSTILQSTQLWTDITEGEAIPCMAKDLDGTKVPPLILGDSAFPFQTWLTKPFTNAVLTPEQHYFNYRLSRARVVTEGAYGQLKGRWRVLMRKCENPPEIVCMVTLACIVLHNICIDQGDTMSKTLDPTMDLQTSCRRERRVIRKLLKMRNCQRVRDNSIQATAHQKCTFLHVLGRKARYGNVVDQCQASMLALHLLIFCNNLMIFPFPPSQCILTFPKFLILPTKVVDTIISFCCC